MILASVFPIFLFVLAEFDVAQASYKVGVGRADCTGPSAEITFMGYAKANQKGCGIHLRQFARAFIFDDGSKKVAFVTVDACMMNYPIRQAVLDELDKAFPKTYIEDNLILSGTHTHSAPGGFLKDVMLDIPNFGFLKETFDALVNGIVRAIKNAHNNIEEEVDVFVNSGELLESNINRSPASYEYNPEEEKKLYNYNTDKTLVQVKIVRKSNNTLKGAINWFAVHPTSMNNTNCLLTSDNVGYASILLESSINKGLPGHGDFVGAFASTNLGDVSPNTKGPKCLNTGKDCDPIKSTCDGKNKWCVASGPGNDMFESTEIIATNMFKKAKDLLDDKSATPVNGEIQFIHKFVDMPSQTATIQVNGTNVEVKGCLPAMGYGFAAGTTDGPGEFDFAQGNKNTSNIFWNIVRDFIFPPTPEDVACHAPKPILIMSGRIQLPYEWQPRVIVAQILKIGNLVLTAVPGEFTTMSGRRLRAAVKQITDTKDVDTTVVITGLSNVYTNYIATPEEYQLQRYEGASTIFGPHTLPIYLKIYSELAEALMKKNYTKDPDEPKPHVFPEAMWSLVPNVIFDSTGSWLKSFGDCIEQPKYSYSIGEVASATFIAGHPRNNNLQEKTFLTIEKKDKDGGWKTVATDANWETRFYWKRSSTFKATSTAEIRWEIKSGVEAGTYRISHFGYYKVLFGGVFPYSGTSRTFTVK